METIKLSAAYFYITKRQFVYYIMPISNLKSVFENGILCHSIAKKLCHDSIANEQVQERRSHVTVPQGMPLHNYVNIYFDVRNPMLYAKRNMRSSLSILCIDISVLDLPDVVVSDMNASKSMAAFYNVELGLKCIDFERVFQQNWTSFDEFEEYRNKGIKCAEILVPYELNASYIKCIKVFDNNSKYLVEQAGFSSDIIDIDPKIFF